MGWHKAGGANTRRPAGLGVFLDKVYLMEGRGRRNWAQTEERLNPLDGPKIEERMKKSKANIRTRTRFAEGVRLVRLGDERLRRSVGESRKVCCRAARRTRVRNAVGRARNEAMRPDPGHGSFPTPRSVINTRFSCAEGGVSLLGQSGAGCGSLAGSALGISERSCILRPCRRWAPLAMGQAVSGICLYVTWGIRGGRGILLRGPG